LCFGGALDRTNPTMRTPQSLRRMARLVCRIRFFAIALSNFHAGGASFAREQGPVDH
jgi:hypothetical protein